MAIKMDGDLPTGRDTGSLTVLALTLLRLLTVALLLLRRLLLLRSTTAVRCSTSTLLSCC